MSRLEVTYDIPPEAFPDLVARIRRHLTPKTDRQISVATRVELEKVRGKLTDKLEPYSFLRLDNIPWDYAAHYTKDLGIFPLKNRDEVDELNRERYSVPSMPGCTRSYTIEIFGKNVNNLGDHPMVVRMDGDFRGHSDELYLLESWYKCFKEEGVDGMVNKIIDVGVKMQGVSPEHDSILAGLPKTSEEFERRIKEARDGLTVTMLDWSINAVRFYWDFFGRPIHEAGYSPSSTTIKGPYNFEYLLSDRDLATITRYPTLPQEQVLRKIFPKHPDDIVIC